MATDGSMTLERGLLRWDISYDYTRAAKNPGIPPRRINATAGWEQALWQDSLLTLQLATRRDWSYHTTASAGRLLQRVTGLNRILSQSFGPVQFWLSSTLTQRFTGDHQAEAIVMAGKSVQYALGGRVSLSLTRGWTWRSKIQINRGPGSSLLGNLDPSSLLYTELQYQF